MTSLLADALLDAATDGTRPRSRVVSDVASWIRRVAVPPRGVRLESTDGASFTGVAVVDRSRVVALVAARHDAPARAADPFVSTYSPFRHRGLDLEDEDDGERFSPR